MSQMPMGPWLTLPAALFLAILPISQGRDVAHFPRGLRNASVPSGH